MNDITAYKAPVKLSKSHLTIKFPINIAKRLKIENGEILWIPTGGTIQIIGPRQELAIPLMPIDTDAFIAQS